MKRFDGIVVLVATREDLVASFRGSGLPALTELQGSCAKFAEAQVVVYEGQVLKSNLWPVPTRGGDAA